MKILEVLQPIQEKHIGESVMINEAPYVLKDIQGFTVTLADPNDPRITTRMNLSDKKIDMTGVNSQGQPMITVTDELSPAERAQMLRKAKGALIDINVSSLR